MRLAGLTAPQATRLVTDQTVEWAQSQGWTVQTEVVGRIVRETRNGPQRARLDLVCTRTAGSPAVAIEIDRHGKTWSLKKLLSEVDAGNLALWVRWHGRTEVAVPDTIGLVDIGQTAGYRRPPRGLRPRT